MVYRGLDLSDQDVRSYKLNDVINLSGYASTSKQKEQSMKFAFREGRNPNNKSVLFHIDLTDGTVGGFCF